MARLTRMTIVADGHHQAHHRGDVALRGRRHRDLAEAGDAEDLLDDHGAAEQADERQGQHGQGGAARVPQDVLEQDAALG